MGRCCARVQVLHAPNDVQYKFARVPRRWATEWREWARRRDGEKDFKRNRTPIYVYTVEDLDRRARRRLRRRQWTSGRRPRRTTTNNGGGDGSHTTSRRDSDGGWWSLFFARARVSGLWVCAVRACGGAPVVRGAHGPDALPQPPVLV